MAILDFPPVTQADEHGLLAVGGDLEIPSLLLAYSRGIFPWPISEEFPLAWFSPDPRGVLFLDQLHIPRSLKKILKRDTFDIRVNENFHAVIKCCALAENRKEGQGTWISQDIIDAYTRLFEAGYAYSVESYDPQTQDLVGGMYGVNIGHFFSGESMFYKKANASKFALAKLLLNMKEYGLKWFDTQMVTSVVQRLGSQEIPRREFLGHLNQSLDIPHDPNLINKLF